MKQILLFFYEPINEVNSSKFSSQREYSDSGIYIKFTMTKLGKFTTS